MSSTLISVVHLLTVPMADQPYLGTPGQLCVDDAVVCLRVLFCVSGGVCGAMWVLHDCDQLAIRGGQPSLSLLHRLPCNIWIPASELGPRLGERADLRRRLTALRCVRDDVAQRAPITNPCPLHPRPRFPPRRLRPPLSPGEASKRPAVM